MEDRLPVDRMKREKARLGHQQLQDGGCVQRQLKSTIELGCGVSLSKGFKLGI